MTTLTRGRPAMGLKRLGELRASGPPLRRFSAPVRAPGVRHEKLSAGVQPGLDDQRVASREDVQEGAVTCQDASDEGVRPGMETERIALELEIAGAGLEIERVSRE